MANSATIMKRAFNCGLVALLLIGHPGWGQTAVPTLPAMTTIIPPSPTAAALGRYGEVPVGLHTGLAEIAIPLYTAKNHSGGGVVDIALNYHAGGIRVDDMGSWVGLGWSLACGGVITRTVHGMADDNTKGYLRRGKDQIQAYLAGGMSDNGLYNLQVESADGKVDLEPDVYSYNFTGHTGQFIFDQAGQPALMPQQALKIEVRTDTTGFRITAADGTVYHFLTPEESGTETVPGRVEPEGYISSWYLTRINPVIGPPIKFRYSAPRDVRFPASISENKDVLVDCNMQVGRPIGKITPYPSETFATIGVVTLRQISLADQTVDFYASARNDVMGLSRLDSIGVSNLSGAFIKRYTFRYALTNRAFLTQVQEKFNAASSVPPYQFVYNTFTLPPLYAKQQDHWGYYNGNTASPPTLIPTTVLTVGAATGGADRRTLVIPGADRTPQFTLTKVGMLTSIAYPTGGTTSFEYEPNDYGQLNRRPNPVHVTTQPRRVSARATKAIRQDAAQFRLAAGQVVNFGVNIDKGGDTRDRSYAEVAVSYRCLTCSATGTAALTPITTQQGSRAYPVSLPPGTYRIYAEYEQSRANSPGFAAVWVDYQDSTGSTVNELSGGLRIRQIVSKASANALPWVKQYTYRFANDSLRSSGCAVFDTPAYQYTHTAEENTPNYEGLQLVTYCMLTANGGARVGMTQGAAVGYSEVTVVEGAGGANGKTVHTFTAANGFPDQGDGNLFPFAPNNSFDYQRGKPLEVLVYRRNGRTYEPVSRTQYGYSNSLRTGQSAQKIVGLKFGRTYKALKLFYHDEFQGQLYSYTSEWVYPTTKVERRYAMGGNAAAYSETTTRYRYANAQHKQLTAQEQTTSNGSSLVSTYRYPLDFGMPPASTPLDEPSAALRTLAARHILNVPIEQQDWRRQGRDSVLLAAQLVHYADVYPKRVWKLDSAVPLVPGNFTPAAVQSTGVLLQDARYRPLMVFEQYDARGNILQQRRTNDNPTSYLWGYRTTLPIAQIRNATYGELQQRLQTLGIAIATLSTDAQFQAAMSRLRQSWPQVQLVSFTYQPLIGVTSQTDPAGRTITYEYNGLGQLVRTRDERGRILSQQQYHYPGR